MIAKLRYLLFVLLLLVFTMAHSIAARGSTSNPSGKEISKVTWQKLRDNAMNKTEFYDISQQSKLLPGLRTVSSVHPQLETVDFYKEGWMSNEDYIPQTVRSYHERKDEHIAGYRKVIALDDILENFKEGQISFVGQAGSGKTTLLKAITRQVIEGKYKNLSSIDVVHFVQLRIFKRNDLVTSAELLFRSVTPEMSDAEMEEAMQYAKQNPDKVHFVIDSLDTVSYTIDGVYTGITTEDRASPEAILFHLLSGNLLPGCRFITSSREYAIRNYEGDVRAKQVIALAGLTKESMRKIVVGYVGEEEAEKKMTYLKQKPVIESLCVTPVWLIFTLMVLSMKSKFTPTTMASILVILLQNMIRSEHVHEGNIEVVVGKLGKMAFTGTKEHRVEFSLDELGNFKLFASEICDLMIATPSGAYQKLILGDSILMYAHQCLQEILSAFHISKMNLKEFKKFISKYIHEPHYAVVRRLLAGILLNSEVFEEAENFLQDATDFVQKGLCLRKTLEGQLKSNLFKEDRLELYMCLSECGDGARDIIQNKVDGFEFSRMTLSSSDMYCIGWVMSLKTFITILNLSECNLTEPSLSALYQALECSSVQIHELNISRNKSLGPDEMTLIAKIFVKCNVKVLTLSKCQPKSDALKALLDSSVGAKLHKFDISNNENFGPDEMTVIAKIFVQCKVKVSSLSACQPKSEALKAFLDSSVGAKLDELDVSGNTFEPDEMMVIAQICKQHEVDRFYVRWCEFLPGALESFLFHSAGAKFDELDVSYNTFGPDEMMVIAQICKQREVDRFRVCGCTFLSGALKSFLFHSVGAKILLLHIGNITRLDGNDGILLGKIIKQCGVETLATWHPEDLKSMDIKDFKLSSENFKISTLECRNKDSDKLREFSYSFCDSVSNLLPYVAKKVILINFHIPFRIVKILQKLLDKRKDKGLKIIHKERVFCGSEGNVESKKFKHKVLECGEPLAENVPSIVENRRAELNNDGSITVSWCYLDEKPDVQYHVEASCNDQPIGNIEICRHPYYECKTPRPLQVYSFRIWVVNSNGIAGTAMFTNEVCSRGLVISKSLQKEVGLDGDHLSVGDCSAVFPRNSFLVLTEVALTAEIDSSKWPKDFLVLTPTLYVNAKGLQEKVCIKLHTWGVINEQNISTLRILHLPTGSNKWENTGIALSFTNSSFLEFEWHDFSPVLGGFWPFRSLNKAVDYIVSGSVFASEFNEFSIAFYVKNNQVSNSVLELMASEKPSKHRKLTISPFSAKLGETVETTLKCCDSDFFLEPTGPFSFTMKKHLAEAPEIHYTAMSSGWQAEKRVNLKGEIKKNGNRIEPGSFGFVDMWKPRERSVFQAAHQQYRTDDRVHEDVGRNNPSYQQRGRRDEASTSTKIGHHDQGSCDIPEHRTIPKSTESPSDLSLEGLQIQGTTPKEVSESNLVKKIHPKRNRSRSKQIQPQMSRGSMGRRFVEEAPRVYHPFAEVGSSVDPPHMSLQREYESLFETEEQHLPLDEPELAETSPMVTDTRGSRNSLFTPMQRGNEMPFALRPELPHDVIESLETHQKLPVAEIHPRQNFNSSNFDQPSTSRRVPPNTGGIMFSRQSEQYYYGGVEGFSYQGCRQMQMGLQGYPNTTGSRPFGLGMETAPRAIVDAEEARRQAPPPEIPEPKLLLERAKIRVSWDKVDDDRVTYCVNIYCNNQLINNTPMRTPKTEIKYSRLKPSCEYQCEVWTCNSRGFESAKTWSNAVNTPDTQECTQSEDESRGGRMLSNQLVSGQGASVTFQNSTIVFGGKHQRQSPEENKKQGSSTSSTEQKTNSKELEEREHQSPGSSESRRNEEDEKEEGEVQEGSSDRDPGHSAE